mgnify:CR=1 FL=1
MSPFASESCKWRQKPLDHFVVWFLISSFAGSPVHQSVPAIKPSFLRFFSLYFGVFEVFSFLSWSFWESFSLVILGFWWAPSALVVVWL